MSGKLLTITVIIFLALAFGMFLFIDSFNRDLNEATGLAVSAESFPTYLETHPAIENLPNKAAIEIKIGENDYEIDGQNVHLSNNDVKDKDIKISLPEGFETVIGELGLCEAVKKAYNENTLSVETYASKVNLLLKYRNLLKYNDCIG